MKKEKDDSVDFLIKDTKSSLYLLGILILFVIVFYCVSALFTAMGYSVRFTAKNADEKIAAVLANKGQTKPTIVLDPGHGGSDPGAVANDLLEKEINLAISITLRDFLSLSGNPIVMTRDTDKLLYDPNEPDQVKRKKFYDLSNRLKLLRETPDSVLVSIHMNKFPIESCAGLQVFYSDTHPDSKTLAQSIQDANKLLDPANHRQVKNGSSTIFLLERADVPAVLVECGFLSNRAEAALLANPVYQNRLAFTLFCGVLG